jgi:serine protease Do
MAGRWTIGGESVGRRPWWTALAIVCVASMVLTSVPPHGARGQDETLDLDPVAAATFLIKRRVTDAAQGTAEEYEVGSGVLVSNDGLILTAAHVLEPAWLVDEIEQAKQMDGDRQLTLDPLVYLDGVENTQDSPSARYAAVLVHADSSLDLAVLKIAESVLDRPAWLDGEAKRLPVAVRHSPVANGEAVTILGYPDFGDGSDAGQSTIDIVHGTVRRVSGNPDTPDAIHIAETVSGGSSGGPVVDANGELVGIVARSDSGSGGGAETVAIPVRLARDMLLDAGWVAPGTVGEAYLTEVQAHVSELMAGIERLEELDPIADGELLPDKANDVLAVVALFTEAPRTASGTIPPAGFEHVQEAYLEFANAIGALQFDINRWLAATNAGESEAESHAASYYDRLDEAAELGATLEEAIADGLAAIDSAVTAPDPIMVQVYLSAVRQHADTLFTGVEQIYASFSEGLDLVTISDQVMDEWMAAPEAAASDEAPQGYAHIQDKHTAMALALEGIALYNDAHVNLLLDDLEDTPAEQSVLDGLISHLLTATERYRELDAALTAEGLPGQGTSCSYLRQRSTVDPEDVQPKPDDNGGAAIYLRQVRDHADQLCTGILVFNSPIRLFETADESRELRLEALTLWSIASSTATGISVPEGYEHIQALYEEMAEAFARSTVDFWAWVDSTDEAEWDALWESFLEWLTTAETLYWELDAALADEGY